MFREVPAKFDFPAAEAEVLRLWEENDVYEKSLKQREGCRPFVFYEGPPTANGLPHPGHCLTRIIKDLFPRYKTMTGHYCHRKGGWDTHGLPVETEVCKELGIHTKQEIEAYGIEKFIRRCQESVFRYTREWEELTRRLGFWINLEEAYVTYHQSYVESVWWALKTLFDKGLLYQDYKVVWWWPEGGTALSAGEVGQGYREVDDPSIYVRFPIVPDERANGLNLSPNTSLLVWTTTPWTLFSNMYAAVHSECDYSVVLDEPSGQQLILASSLVEVIAKKIRQSSWKETQTIKGEDLVGLRYEPPFDCYYRRKQTDDRPEDPDSSLPQLLVTKMTWGETKAPLRGGTDLDYVAWRVVSAEFVTLDTGTGIVHVAPAFGEDDFNLSKQERERFDEYLPMFCAVSPQGILNPVVGEDYAGRRRKDTDSDVIRDLKQRGLLVHQEQYRHDCPFCWRAEDDPLIQYARKSWFIRTTEFRDAFLDNNRRINWLPEHIRDGRFGNFLEDNVDWALSRERFWGTPLPIWECEQTGKQEAVASYAELLRKPGVAGTDVWEKAKRENPELIDDLKVHKPYIDAITYESPFAMGARMRRVPEVIDCWFDSGCMPFAQWGYPHANRELFKDRFPADFISEAIDQTRGWFYTLLAISTMLFGEQTTERAAGFSPRGAGTTEVATTSGEREAAQAEACGSLNATNATFAREYPHPFRNCIVLGLVAGEDGKKLSKSKRNYKEPSYIFDREGADAMRWSMLSSQAPWTGARFKEDTIATDQREFLIKLYNVYSFLVIYANIDKWSPADPHAQDCEPSELDRWIAAEMHQTIADIRAAMDRYENYPACRRLVDFVDALSNWYVRRSRERFWRSGMDADKKAAYLTLWACLGKLSELIAPFTPFFAETLYQNLVRSQFPDRHESVHLRDYPEPDESKIDRKLMAEMAIVREIASLGRSARMDARIKVRQPLPVVELVLADPSHRQWLESHLPLIADELNVKRIEFAADANQYVTYEVKPSFKSIGPKFGKLAPGIKQALASAVAADLHRQLDEHAKVSLTVGGKSIELAPEDVQISLQARPGWTAAQGRQVVVVLSTEITDELKAEGLARDLVHLIQNARKTEQLDYQARIRLRVNAAGPLADAIRAHGDYICHETLATELVLDASVTDAGYGGEIEGAPVRFTLEVVA